jgi:hypothetical protein
MAGSAIGGTVGTIAGKQVAGAVVTKKNVKTATKAAHAVGKAAKKGAKSIKHAFGGKKKKKKH